MYTLPFAKAFRKINNRGLNLKEAVKDIYKEHIKLVKKDTIKWKDILCSWIVRINI